MRLHTEQTMTPTTILAQAATQTTVIPDGPWGLIGVVVTGIAGATGLWSWIRGVLERERQRLDELERERSEQIKRLGEALDAAQRATQDARTEIAGLRAEVARLETHLASATQQLVEMRRSNDLLERVLKRRERRLAQLGELVSDPEEA
jgi:flagellar motility protein MotE (MotC chaperone)